MHHVIVGVYDPKIADERMRMIKASSPSLGAYVPGNGPTMYPQDTGVLVRKDQASRSRCTTRLRARRRTT